MEWWARDEQRPGPQRILRARVSALVRPVDPDYHANRSDENHHVEHG